jgi:hypothetical protein|tara:strand:- start:2690 stop:2890 length:201 start_codon:yes stop_codon:yes gene_type:complete
MESIKEMVMMGVDWVKDRLSERTSWDGIVLIAIGSLILIASPLTKIAALVAIGYGVFTILKDEGMF